MANDPFWAMAIAIVGNRDSSRGGDAEEVGCEFRVKAIPMPRLKVTSSHGAIIAYAVVGLSHSRSSTGFACRDLLADEM